MKNDDRNIAAQGKDIWTIGAVLNWTRQYFDDKGVDNPRLDAEILLSHILGKDRLYLYVNFDQPLEQAELAAFRELVRQRARRVPVAYITGRKEFMGLNFTVTPAVLIPRPDTEILVEAVLSRLRTVDNPEVVDIGTGSGAIIISILKNRPTAGGMAVDISDSALAVAAANARQHQVSGRLSLVRGDLLAPAKGRKFDAIVSNPPYIPDRDIAGLPPEVGCEPRLALAGGIDGLNFYRRIISVGAEYLRAGGFIALEVGAGQAAAVAGLAGRSLLTVEEIIKDYAGIDRVVVLTCRQGVCCKTKF